MPGLLRVLMRYDRLEEAAALAIRHLGHATRSVPSVSMQRPAQLCYPHALLQARVCGRAVCVCVCWQGGGTHALSEGQARPAAQPGCWAGDSQCPSWRRPPSQPCPSSPPPPQELANRLQAEGLGACNDQLAKAVKEERDGAMRQSAVIQQLFV